MTLNYNIRSWF